MHHVRKERGVHAEWHTCSRWWKRGLQCPYTTTGAPDPQGPPDGEPEATPHGRGRPGVGAMARDFAFSAAAAGAAALLWRYQASFVLEEAEETVARSAETVPVSEGKSLADVLGTRGVVGGAAAAAAGLAMSDVLNRSRMRSGRGAGTAGGGYNIEMVFDPRKALPVR